MVFLRDVNLIFRYISVKCFCVLHSVRVALIFCTVPAAVIQPGFYNGNIIHLLKRIFRAQVEGIIIQSFMLSFCHFH